ncbi:MAG: sodium/proton-translocating pyrophosphatase, partial [Streptosporangiales bacterium]
NILSGFVAGNFSAYWLGFTMLALMSVGYFVSTTFPEGVMLAPAVFAFGLVAFGFLGMGPVTIAVDSYGPVTDNAQSIYELSMIETLPGEAVSRILTTRSAALEANLDLLTWAATERARRA